MKARSESKIYIFTLMAALSMSALQASFDDTFDVMIHQGDKQLKYMTQIGHQDDAMIELIKNKQKKEELFLEKYKPIENRSKKLYSIIPNFKKGHTSNISLVKTVKSLSALTQLQKDSIEELQNYLENQYKLYPERLSDLYITIKKLYQFWFHTKKALEKKLEDEIKSSFSQFLVKLIQYIKKDPSRLTDSDTWEDLGNCFFQTKFPSSFSHALSRLIEDIKNFAINNVGHSQDLSQKMIVRVFELYSQNFNYPQIESTEISGETILSELIAKAKIQAGLRISAIENFITTDVFGLNAGHYLAHQNFNIAFDNPREYIPSFMNYNRSNGEVLLYKYNWADMSIQEQAEQLGAIFAQKIEVAYDIALRVIKHILVGSDKPAVAQECLTHMQNNYHTENCYDLSGEIRKTMGQLEIQAQLPLEDRLIGIRSDHILELDFKNLFNYHHSFWAENGISGGHSIHSLKKLIFVPDKNDPSKEWVLNLRELKVNLHNLENGVQHINFEFECSARFLRNKIFVQDLTFIVKVGKSAGSTIFPREFSAQEIKHAIKCAYREALESGRYKVFNENDFNALGKYTYIKNGQARNLFIEMAVNRRGLNTIITAFPIMLFHPIEYKDTKPLQMATPLGKVFKNDKWTCWTHGEIKTELLKTLTDWHTNNSIGLENPIVYTIKEDINGEGSFIYNIVNVLLTGCNNKPIAIKVQVVNKKPAAYDEYLYPGIDADKL